MNAWPEKGDFTIYSFDDGLSVVEIWQASDGKASIAGFGDVNLPLEAAIYQVVPRQLMKVEIFEILGQRFTDPNLLKSEILKRSIAKDESEAINISGRISKERRAKYEREYSSFAIE